VDVVVTHPYEHGHPDHDVASLAVHAGCALLEREHGAAPAIVEFASYHLDGSRLAFGEFFPAPRHPEHVARHDDADRARKARALRCFRTQHAIFGSMVAPDERFRAAPRYDFAQPAPPGAAWYDRLGWRITSAEWRRRAVRGLAELGLDPAPWR
jgi:LmbE family N-acetylglucosaminyl deacetylase